MATAISYSKTGSKHEAAVKLEQAIFGLEANHELVGQAYRTYLANGRNAHPATLTRGLVAGGGRKPWRQKGTGRARVGSIRVPNWRGGGVVFAPTGNENHTLTLPAKMKHTALRQALSLRAAAGDIVVLESFDSADGKVKGTVELLSKMKLEGSVLLAVETKTELIIRATRNLAGLKTVGAKYLNVYDVMNADKLVLTQAALDAIKVWLGEK
ncbi:MAG TPA: 50S ribosomal protein L4 [Candidatus Saccharimonadia bacterium]|nr:50S ribosomal protein L4 [Candidatus Saccharimonadia bacterium]